MDQPVGLGAAQGGQTSTVLAGIDSFECIPGETNKKGLPLQETPTAMPPRERIRNRRPIAAEVRLGLQDDLVRVAALANNLPGDPADNLHLARVAKSRTSRGPCSSSSSTASCATSRI